MYEFEVLKKQDYCIKQISTQKSRRIDLDSIHVFSAHIHYTKSQQEPRLKTLKVNEVDSRKAAKFSIIVRFLGVNHCSTGLNHHFSSLKIDKSS